MKLLAWVAALAPLAAAPLAAAANIRNMFLFKDVLKSNTTALTTSGFTSLVMFGVGILPNGDIMYYSNTPGSVDTVVASGGAYVGGDALRDKVRSFKSAPGSSVDSVEICMNAVNVRELMASPGPGENTNLYRNFAALKEAWALDAVNNNDEWIYDVESSVAFAQMVGRVGYTYTATPYTNVRFWQTLRSRLGAGLFTQAYLQCYDGGAANDPIAWQTSLGMKVVPLIWVTNDAKPGQGNTAAQARSRFAGWLARGTMAGGGYWNEYDIEKMGLSYGEYSGVLNSLFP